MKIVKILGIAIPLAASATAAFVWSGLYPMGADVPHAKVTFWLLETLRERSIARASRDIVVPSIESSDMLLGGGADYNDMCAGCHLRPGVSQNDFTIGLYPKPPNLAMPGREHGEADFETRRDFWIIKHGIKASGMPAWGPTHDDDRIWAMVAFLRKLPELSEEQYQVLTARDGSEPAHH